MPFQEFFSLQGRKILFHNGLYFLNEMQKTKKSIAKRFKITASGKVLRRSPGKRHLLSAKTIKQKRAAGHDKPVTPGVASNVKKAMPFA